VQRADGPMAIFAHRLISFNFASKGQQVPLGVSRGKLNRLLSYVGSFLMFPLLRLTREGSLPTARVGRRWKGHFNRFCGGSGS